MGAAASPNSRWAWLGDWRWLAVPAAAALAFAVFGFLWMRPGRDTSQQAPASPPVALSAAQAQSQQPTPATDAYARDDKQTKAQSVAPAPLPVRPPAGGMALKSAPSGTRNPPAMVTHSARRDATSAFIAHRQSGVGDGAVLAKNEQAKPPAGAAASGGGIGSTSQSVEVTSTARAAAAPAKPPVEAKQTGEATSGAGTGAGAALNGNPAADVASTINNANVEQTETRPKARKTLQQSVAPAIEAALSKKKNNDSSQLITIGDQPAATMILTPDPAILWRFAGSGFVERSTDGGATWQGEQPSEGGQVLAGSAPSANVCWLVGRDGLILLTKDARSWKKIAPPEETDFIAVSAENAPNATVTTADGRKFATRNGGKKWKPAEKVATPSPN